MKLSIILSALMMTLSSFAQVIEPGPVRSNVDTNAVVSILLNSQLKSCLKQVYTSGLELDVSNVSVQNLKPRVTRYLISSNGLQGDINVGTVILNIVETIKGEGDTMSKTYKCNVSFPEVRIRN